MTSSLSPLVKKMSEAMKSEGWIILTYNGGCYASLPDTHPMAAATGLLRSLCTQLLYSLRGNLRLDLALNEERLQDVQTGNIVSLCMLFDKLLENTIADCGNRPMVACLIDGAHFLERSDIVEGWWTAFTALRYTVSGAICGPLNQYFMFKFLIIHGNTSLFDDRPFFLEDKLAVCGTAEAFRKAEEAKDIIHQRVGQVTGYNLREDQKSESARTGSFGQPVLNLFGPSPDEAFPHAGLVPQDYSKQPFWTFDEFAGHLPDPLYPGAPPQIAAISPLTLSGPPSEYHEEPFARPATV